MRRVLLLLTILITACSSPTQQATAQPPAPAPPSAPAASLPAPPPALAPPPAAIAQDSSPQRPPRFLRTSLSGIKIEAISFDARRHHLLVADQPNGPASQWPDCRAAGKANQGLAAINAGFFTPEGAPLGRVITPDHRAGSTNRASSLGAGFFIESQSGSMSLIRRDQFSSARQALQSGPFLIENSQRVAGLSDKQSTARSFIATNGQSHWIIARTGACSLAELASALNGQAIDGIPITSALNLDGGRSSEIWVSDQVPGGSAFVRPFWNKPVRNYLVLHSR